MSDAAWAVIEPLPPLPVGRARGRWRERCQMLEDIVFKFRTGVPWGRIRRRGSGWGRRSTGASLAGRPTAPSTGS
ncbi:hypothetical protein SHIRM173S_03907 [Streptomyces hirsutus]